MTQINCFIDDANRENWVRGWAYSIERPNSPLEILVFDHDYTVVGRGWANVARPDLVVAGHPTAHCGFEIDVAADARHPLIIRAIVTSELIGSFRSHTRPEKPVVIGFVDSISNMKASGWAYDPAGNGRLTVEACLNDVVIASTTANLPRPDIATAGLGPSDVGFVLSLGTHDAEALVFRVQSTNGPLTIPRAPSFSVTPSWQKCFLQSRKKVSEPTIERLRARSAKELEGFKLSIVMPIFRTPPSWLRVAIDSVLNQWCPCWQLICVDDGSDDPRITKILSKYKDDDSRISVITCECNIGVAAATNRGIAAATGDFIAVLDHDDALEPNAVWQILRAASDQDVDLVYSDEIITSEDINDLGYLIARPAFSHDYYLSHPYFVHFIAYRRGLIEEIGGLDEQMAVSHDVDLTLRALEMARRVSHVPLPLYRWRTSTSSLGHAKSNAVTQATVGALNRSIERLSLPARAKEGSSFNQFHIDWVDPGGKILIVIPTKNGLDLVRQAVRSIEATCDAADYRLVVIDHQSDDPKAVAYFKSLTDRHIVMPYEGPFNFSAMNNAAVAAHGTGCPYVIFLNNDIVAIEKGWLNRMRSLAARSDVGIVGALLLYPEGDHYNKVQHAGVIVGLGGAADHAFHFIDAFGIEGERENGFNSSLVATREFSAVTAACIIMRKEVFDSVGGYDVKLKIGFNDTDLCLRVGKTGLKILYDGRTMLYHHESATRRADEATYRHHDDSRLFVKRWAHAIEAGDPYYSPLLSHRPAEDHSPVATRSGIGPLTPRVREPGFGKPRD